MAGIVPKFSGGPMTFKVAAKVTGGQVVSADTTNDGVKVAGVGDLAIGVALTDAIPTATAVSDDFGNPIIPTGAYPTHTTVAGIGFVVPVTFAANAEFGVLVKAAANGTVTPWVSGTDSPSLIVGKVMDPAGVVIATNAVGNIKVLV